MSKMLLMQATAQPRAGASDLLGQLGQLGPSSSGRSAHGSGVHGSSEAATGFAQLLQAKASSVGTPARAAAPGAPQPPQAQGSTPPPHAGHAAEENHPSARTDTSDAPSTPARTASNDGARRQDPVKAGGARRQGETPGRGQAGAATEAPSSADGDPQDPVLAQVLRQLRADDGEGDARETAEAPQAKPDDMGTASAASGLAPQLLQQAQLQQQAQALPPAAKGGNAEADAQEDGAADKAGLDRPGKERRGGLAVLDDGAAPAGTATTDRDAARVDGPAGDRSAAASSFAGALQQAQQAPAVHDRVAAESIGTARYELHAPVHGSGFAPEMAARLSLAAADGVQQAQLHLNPAEMGPVQVQIVLDGQQAQISFVAEQADTRAVLEKSLPELAGALREQGLTLSGGGVFSQQQPPSGQAGQPDQDASRQGPRWTSAALGSAGSDDATTAQTRIASPVARSRGVLDLFA